MTEEANTNQATTDETKIGDSLLDVKGTPELDFSLGKPEGFPDEFWDAEKKTPALNKLFESYTQEKKRAEGLRVKLSKGEFEGKPPEDIKEYALELSDELKPLVPDDDPLLNAARQAAKDAGLPKDAFGKFMLPVISKLAELKKDADTPLSDEEVAAAKSEELAKLGPSGNRIARAVSTFIDELTSGGTLTASEAKALKDGTVTADGVRALNKLRMMSGGRDQVPIDVPVDEKASRMEIEKKLGEALVKNDEAEYTKYQSMLAKINQM